MRDSRVEIKAAVVREVFRIARSQGDLRREARAFQNPGSCFRRVRFDRDFRIRNTAGARSGEEAVVADTFSSSVFP